MKQYIRWCVLILLLVALTPFAAACASPELSPGVFIDDIGRTVNIEKVPQRIVSLAPSNTEILFALGLKDKIVGVTEFCNYPDGALDKPKVGGFAPFDLEAVVALEPDLALAAEIHEAEGIPALERLGLTVLALAPKTVEEVLACITLVGEFTGKNQEATRLVASLEKRIKRVTEITQLLTDEERPGVLFVTWHDPLWVAGEATFVDDLITKAGGKNIAYDLTDWAIIDLETVIARNPRVIIVTHRADVIRNEPRLGVTEAVIENRVYLVEGDIFKRAAPRLVNALEQLAGLLHSELFRNP